MTEKGRGEKERRTTTKSFKFSSLFFSVYFFFPFFFFFLFILIKASNGPLEGIARSITVSKLRRDN